MLDVLTPESSAALAMLEPNEIKLSRAEKREAIDRELRADPCRNDNQIARVCAADHKTVAARRREIQNSLNRPNSQTAPAPTEFRSMLIEGCKDFDGKHPPDTAEEAVDNALASGKISHANAGRGGVVDSDGREAAIGAELAQSKHSSVQAAVDMCRGAMLRVREERQAEAAQEDEANGEETLMRPQREITIQFRDDVGEWVLKQKSWPDDDAEISINEEHIHQFIDALTDRLGYGRAP